MFKRKYILVACFFLLAVSLKTKSLDADIYVYKDKNGKLHFLNVPSEGYRKVLREKDQSDPPKEESGARVSPNVVEEKLDEPVKDATSPVSEVGKEAIDVKQPINQPEANSSPLDVYIILFVILFASLLILYLRDHLGSAISRHILPKRYLCLHCKARTKNNNRICDACKTRMDYEEAKAQERETQEREARERAEGYKRREEQAKAQEQRKRDEDGKQKRPASIADLQRLTGDQFESLVASLFERDGYKVTRRGGSGDEGIDIILHLGMEKDVVQCKRWKNDIGSPVIREFYGSMMHVGARHGFVITTASFSSSAREFSAGKPIILIDGQYLLSWVNGTKSTRSDTGARATRGDGFDPYEILQVTRGASKEEIRAAYLNLIKQYHPDKVSHLGKEFRDIAEEKTQGINRAYEILTSR